MDRLVTPQSESVQMRRAPIAVWTLVIFWAWSAFVFGFYAIDLARLSSGICFVVSGALAAAMLKRIKVALFASAFLTSVSLGASIARVIFTHSRDNTGMRFSIAACAIGLLALYAHQTRSSSQWFLLPNTRLGRLLFWLLCMLVTLISEFAFAILFNRRS